MISSWRHQDKPVALLLLVDYCVIVGTFAVVMRLRFMPEIDIIDISELRIIPQVLFMFFYAFFIMLVFNGLGMYKRKVWLSASLHILAITKSSAIATVGYIFLQYVSKSVLFLEYRSVTFAWGAFLFSSLILLRLGLFPLIRKGVFKGDLRRRVVVLGASDVGKEFALKCLSGQNYPDLKVIGFMDDDTPQTEEVVKGLRNLGEISSLRDNLDLYKIEGAVITAFDLSYQRLMDVIEECVRLFGWVDIHCDKASCLQDNLDADTYFEIPFVRLTGIPDTFMMHLYKRVSDLAMAGAGLVVLSPLLLLTTILVKLSSPGPVFYATERIGFKGKRIKFYKFRSMRMGADQDEKRQEATHSYIRGDAPGLPSKIVPHEYVTPVGRVIRKWGIDELPQLFSVLKGDMSMVGPRPSPINEYEVNDDWHKKRFDVKPGCTGLWKLYATRFEGTTFNHSVLYDIYYTRNMSPLMDLYVILGTVRLILSGKADG
ncbi:MAG: sugar transferase [Kiritimatiellia bacterium]|jgi:lipopolysaccharide/colanic/teichoic acid biosynthesis glycosyltransferase|nr:sugar transferase [Kiritimatiellia bacterium]MDP6847898.1 sugar transferase [Kiritimatiellia bacterium]